MICEICGEEITMSWEDKTFTLPAPFSGQWHERCFLRAGGGMADSADKALKIVKEYIAKNGTTSLCGMDMICSNCKHEEPYLYKKENGVVIIRHYPRCSKCNTEMKVKEIKHIGSVRCPTCYGAGYICYDHPAFPKDSK